MRLARENPSWGAVRIQGELRTLGHDISEETVRRYRLRARLRLPTRRWREFLHNHRHEIWAADSFTVPTLTLSTLYVFFVISHGRRRIEYLNVTRHPTAEWVWQQLIEATPWGAKPRFLIRDRDRAYGGDFVARARRVGIKTALTPVRAPKANAVAERVIGTLRRECVDHIIPLSERHLRSVLREYVDYYNATRPHRTLELEPPPVRARCNLTLIPFSAACITATNGRRLDLSGFCGPTAALVRSDFDRFADIVNERAVLVDGLLSELNVDTTAPTNLVYLPTKLTLRHRADNLLALDLLFRTLLEQDDRNETLLDEQLRLVASAD